MSSDGRNFGARLLTALYNYNSYPDAYASRSRVYDSASAAYRYMDAHPGEALAYTPPNPQGPVDPELATAIDAIGFGSYEDGIIQLDQLVWAWQSDHGKPIPTQAFAGAIAALAPLGADDFCSPYALHGGSGTLGRLNPAQQSSPRQRDIIPDGGGSVDIQNAPYTVARLIRDQDWAVWGTNASAARAGDFTYLAQSGTVQEALSRIPRSWKVTRQGEGVGYVFTNPDSAALVTEVRIKVPMARFNRDWRSFAQLRIGKEVGKGYPGADKFGMVYYDRNLQLTTNLDAMHIRLEFGP